LRKVRDPLPPIFSFAWRRLSDRHHAVGLNPARFDRLAGPKWPELYPPTRRRKGVVLKPSEFFCLDRAVIFIRTQMERKLFRGPAFEAEPL